MQHRVTTLKDQIRHCTLHIQCVGAVVWERIHLKDVFLMPQHELVVPVVQVYHLLDANYNVQKKKQCNWFIAKTPGEECERLNVIKCEASLFVC